MTTSLPQVERLPAHVAVIMDGNGRWAQRRGLPRLAGHRKGVDAVRAVVEAAGEVGLGALTLYSFSSENWRRPLEEVNGLMGLLQRYLRSETAELHAKGVRIRVIGERDRLAPDIVDLIDQAEALTQNNDKLILQLALSYGGRQDIVGAARALAERVAKGALAPEQIDENAFAQALSTHGVPEPDLLIRTSGEQRISNFLLWELAYTEMVFVDVLWPDFTRDHFVQALQDFAARDRRFGATTLGSA